MRYKCEFPGCDFETDYGHQIHEHHIIPREANGSNDKWNKINVCANHHGFIFCHESKTGIHAIKTKNSIVLKGWRFSSSGKTLEYIDVNGELKYYDV